MGLINNGSRNHLSAAFAFGTGATAFSVGARDHRGGWMNFVTQDMATTVLNTAKPTGYAPQAAYQMAIEAGEVSMRSGGYGTLTADLLPSLGMTLDLTGSGDLDATAALVVSLIAAFTGSGTLSATITGRLNASVDFTGSGSMTAGMTALGNMSAALTGTGDLDALIAAYGDMSVDITVTGTGLSTANVGAAVWDALAASFNTPGTMGEKLNSASSAGDPWGTALPGAYAVGTAGWMLGLLEKFARNKIITDPVAGTYTLYANDGTTVLLTGSLFEDAAGTQPYQGQGSERRERLT